MLFTTISFNSMSLSVADLHNFSRMLETSQFQLPQVIKLKKYPLSQLQSFSEKCYSFTDMFFLINL
jgi:hypothetical protein